MAEKTLKNTSPEGSNPGGKGKAQEEELLLE